MAKWTQLGLQDASSPLMEELIYFHDYTLIILTLITIVVFYGLASLLFSTRTKRFFLEGQGLETVWTIIPAVILIFIALPSLQLLYLMDEVKNPFLTIKAIGHQWYWRYEYADYRELDFDSYMIPTTDLQKGHPRLLEVDKRLVLPSQTPIRVLVSSSDVLHSWTVPSLGIKMDAVPGRLNQVKFFISRCGIFYGQCSEICGANHRFMPIVIESIKFKSFENWVSKFLKESLISLYGSIKLLIWMTVDVHRPLLRTHAATRLHLMTTKLPHSLIILFCDNFHSFKKKHKAHQPIICLF